MKNKDLKNEYKETFDFSTLFTFIYKKNVFYLDLSSQILEIDGMVRMQSGTHCKTMQANSFTELVKEKKRTLDRHTWSQSRK